MMKYFMYFYLLIGLALLTGCSGGLVSPGDTIGMKLSSFPMSAGSSWTFVISDSISNSNAPDTVSFKILQTQDKSKLKQSLWTLNYIQLMDSTVVNPNGGNIVYPWIVLHVHKSDSIKVNISSGSIHFGFRQGTLRPTELEPVNFNFPLQAGKKWSGSNTRYSVISNTSVKWKKGVFKNCYQIIQNIDANNGYNVGTIKYWVKPGVGIIKINQNEEVGNFEITKIIKTTWTLMSYKIR